MQAAERVIIIGGGAAGFFAAIACAETLGASSSTQVYLYEATEHPLAKVRISGGGRCNVTHACFDPREFAKRYPRGGRELIGPLSRFGAKDTQDWFLKQGVYLKAEEDGRMFPTTDNSWTIVECLKAAAAKAGVHLITGRGVKELKRRPEGGFEALFTNGSTQSCDRVLIATGGNAESGGMAMARLLGHQIEDTVPSLFTFQVQDPRIDGLAGLSVPQADLRVAGSKLKESGPLLITHWGLSGPAVLRLSAWGARELAGRNYSFSLLVNWCKGLPRDKVLRDLCTARDGNPRKQVGTWCPIDLPSRLWERLLVAAGIPQTTVWTSLSNDSLGRLAGQITEGSFQVTGKSTNKEEFVTCGGVRLSEVDFKTMESRLCPGLYFAGEVLDIDGITGGFNFQNAWTTGWLAGKAMATSKTGTN